MEQEGAWHVWQERPRRIRTVKVWQVCIGKSGQEGNKKSQGNGRLCKKNIPSRRQ